MEVTRALETALAAASPSLFSYLQRRVGFDDAADLLGETMVVGWRRAKDLPDDPERARMWLFGIARKTLLNHARGERRRWALADRIRVSAETGSTQTMRSSSGCCTGTGSASWKRRSCSASRRPLPVVAMRRRRRSCGRRSAWMPSRRQGEQSGRAAAWPGRDLCNPALPQFGAQCKPSPMPVRGV